MNGHAEVTARIDAPADRVYRVLADYREEHPRILPPAYFKSLTVAEGGVGAGTVFDLEMTVMGTRRSGRFVVTEPEPGRVLSESSPDGTIVTRFTVEPRGGASDVTIATRWAGRDGLIGRIERWMTAAVLRRIYAKELALLSAHVRA